MAVAATSKGSWGSRWSPGGGISVASGATGTDGWSNAGRSLGTDAAIWGTGTAIDRGERRESGGRRRRAPRAGDRSRRQHRQQREGQGEAGPRGGPSGDLYVAVKVKAHPALVRRGTELYHELPVTFPQAALGATLAVPTVEGEDVEVEIPPGSQSGREIRIKGRGVPRMRGAGRGDLHVIVNVVVPSKLSKRERELLRELDEVSGPASLPRGEPSVIDRLRDLFG